MWKKAMLIMLLVMSTSLSACEYQSTIEHIPYTEIRQIFFDNVGTFTTGAKLLLENDSYWEDMETKYHTQSLGSSYHDRSILADPDHEYYFSDIEWKCISILYQLCWWEEAYYTGRGVSTEDKYYPCGVRIMRFQYNALDKDGAKCHYTLFYIRATEEGTPEQQAEEVEAEVSYWNQTYDIKKLDAEGWYEAID